MIKKDKNFIAFIVFGAFLLTAFIFLQSPASSGDRMVANVLVEQLQNQISNLWKQVELLREKIAKINETKQDLLDTKPPVLNNLEPEHVIATKGVITWGTDELSDSAVIYADEYIQKYVENSKKMTATDSELVTFHEVLLTGLKPNTVYYYYVSSTDPNGNNSLSNTHTITTTTLPQE